MYQQLYPKYYGYRFDDSPVASTLEDFSQWLREAGYCTTKQREHAANLRRVLERDPDRSPTARFDDEDLKRLFRSPVRPRSFAHTRTVFKRYLVSHDQLILPTQTCPHQDLIDACSAFMRDLQGLSETTICQKQRVIGRFLAECCAPPRSVADTTPHDVERFIARRARRVGRAAMQNTVCNLRAFLHFCQERGLCASGLLAIDQPQRFRDERPPRAIPWALAQQFLASIDRTTRTGCRDHAMFHLMAHYGLRTGEIAALRVSDIDVARAVLHVRQPKVRTTLNLPMSRLTARVLTKFLKFGRPSTSRPELFIKLAAPLGPMTRMGISEAFRRHVHRSGLPLLDCSPYGLRHGFAMRLLERGVGIKTIGDLLGHHTIESTSVYLRLNTEALREVALPVPRSAISAGRVS